MSSIKIKDAEKIHNDIRYMLETGVSYMEAIVEYAQINGMEIETVAAIVKKSPIMVEKLKQEAIANKLVLKEEDNATICD